ncbi:MAG: glycerophosphodiester phosphodiesterase [Geodermatophilaceae bacterium]|nr:glycerophosphodiester phosphodiesterase [Geodermatophilaceae bacterium]
MRLFVTAHRGDTSTEPEHTLAAYEAAVAKGCDAVEICVRLSADGVAVVRRWAYLDDDTNLPGTGPPAIVGRAGGRSSGAGGSPAVPAGRCGRGPGRPDRPGDPAEVDGAGTGRRGDRCARRGRRRSCSADREPRGPARPSGRVGSRPRPLPADPADPAVGRPRPGRARCRPAGPARPGRCGAPEARSDHADGARSPRPSFTVGAHLGRQRPGRGRGTDPVGVEPVLYRRP